MIWNGMIWYGMVWCDMVWYDVIWYDTIWYDMIWYDMIWWYMIWYICQLQLGSHPVAAVQYTFTHRTTQLIWEECWPCPVFVSFTLAFALQLRKKHGKTLSRGSRSASTHITKTTTHYKTYTHTHTHTHTLQNNIKPPQHKLKQTQYRIYPNVCRTFAQFFCGVTVSVCYESKCHLPTSHISAYLFICLSHAQ
jgi:hypothetical protein